MNCTPSEIARDLMEMGYLLVATNITFRQVITAAIPTLIDRFERFGELLGEE